MVIVNINWELVDHQRLLGNAKVNQLDNARVVENLN